MRWLLRNKLLQDPFNFCRQLGLVWLCCCQLIAGIAWADVVLAAAVGQPASEAGSTSDFLAAIQEKAAGITSFTCSFQQTRHMAMFTKPVKFSGRLMVAKPDKLRWEFLAPIPSALLFNGNKGMRCNDQAPPVPFDLQSDPVMHVVARQLWLWLRADYAQLQDEYRLHLTGSETLEVTPLDSGMAQYISKVVLLFDPATGHPRQVTITEPGGDLTEIVFQTYLLNPQLSQEVFTACDDA